MGSVVEGRAVYEVQLVDNNLCGGIFTLGGIDNIAGKFNRAEDDNIWKELNLEIGSDAKLNLKARDIHDNHFGVKGNMQLPPGKWTHVHVSVEGNQAKVFCDGVLSVGATFLGCNAPEKSTLPMFVGQIPRCVSSSPLALQPAAAVWVCDVMYYASDSCIEKEVSSLVVKQHPNLPTNVAAATDQLFETLKVFQCNARFIALYTSQAASSLVIAHLFNILVRGTPVLKTAALRVCTRLLPHYDFENVEAQAQIIGLIHNGSFVAHVFQQVGIMFNHFSRISSWTADGNCEDTVIRPHSESLLCVRLGYLQLLRVLAGSTKWEKEVVRFIESVMSTLPQLVKKINEACEQEVNLESLSSVSELAVTDSALQGILGVLGLCGEAVPGFYTGCRARCAASSFKCDGDDECSIFEDCTVIMPTWPPTLVDIYNISKNDGQRRERLLKKWKECSTLGDCYFVTLDSDPAVPLLVHQDDLIYPDPNKGGSSEWNMDAFVRKVSSPLLVLFESLSGLVGGDICKAKWWTPKKAECTTIDIIVDFSKNQKPTLVAFPKGSHVTVAHSYESHRTMNLKFLRVDNWAETYGSLAAESPSHTTVEIFADSFLVCPGKFILSFHFRCS